MHNIILMYLIIFVAKNYLGECMRWPRSTLAPARGISSAINACFFFLVIRRNESSPTSAPRDDIGSASRRDRALNNAFGIKDHTRVLI